jgi:CRP-like cAMP-binding protein
MFKQLNLHQKHRIAYLAQELRFKAKTVIFKKGEVSSCLYVVKSGKVLLTIPERDPVEVKVK